MTPAILCSAVLAAAVFVLGANVTRMRVVTAKAGGPQASTDPTNPLFIAIRAHGNAAEYVPTLMVLFLLAGARSPLWIALPLMIIATLARLLHAYGMLRASSLAARNAPREIGALGTYAAGVALAVVAAVPW
jgi:uncharacterized membrane protein YecN with MAPEG domain